MASRIKEQIRKEIPSVRKLTIHLEGGHAGPGRAHARNEGANGRSVVPFKRRYSVIDRVLACTDISVLRHVSEYHVTLTCRIDSATTLEEVHQIIAEVETRLYQTFGQVRRFTLHAEPVEPG